MKKILIASGCIAVSIAAVIGGVVLIRRAKK